MPGWPAKGTEPTSAFFCARIAGYVSSLRTRTASVSCSTTRLSAARVHSCPAWPTRRSGDLVRPAGSCRSASSRTSVRRPGARVAGRQRLPPARPPARQSLAHHLSTALRETWRTVRRNILARPARHQGRHRPYPKGLLRRRQLPCVPRQCTHPGIKPRLRHSTAHIMGGQ